MNKFKFYFIVTIASVSLFSCSKDDPSATIEPPRDYQKQYDAETNHSLFREAQLNWETKVKKWLSEKSS